MPDGNRTTKRWLPGKYEDGEESTDSDETGSDHISPLDPNEGHNFSHWMAMLQDDLRDDGHTDSNRTTVYKNHQNERESDQHTDSNKPLPRQALEHGRGTRSNRMSANRLSQQDLTSELRLFRRRSNPRTSLGVTSYWFQDELDDKTRELTEAQRKVIDLDAENRKVARQLEQLTETLIERAHELEIRDNELRDTRNALNLEKAQNELKETTLRHAESTNAEIQAESRRALSRAHEQSKEYKAGLSHQAMEIRGLKEELVTASREVHEAKRQLSKSDKLSSDLDALVKKLQDENELLKARYAEMSAEPDETSWLAQHPKNLQSSSSPPVPIPRRGQTSQILSPSSAQQTELENHDSDARSQRTDSTSSSDFPAAAFRKSHSSSGSASRIHEALPLELLIQQDSGMPVAEPEILHDVSPIYERPPIEPLDDSAKRSAAGSLSSLIEGISSIIRKRPLSAPEYRPEVECMEVDTATNHVKKMRFNESKRFSEQPEDSALKMSPTLQSFPDLEKRKSIRGALQSWMCGPISRRSDVIYHSGPEAGSPTQANSRVRRYQKAPVKSLSARQREGLKANLPFIKVEQPPKKARKLFQHDQRYTKPVYLPDEYESHRLSVGKFRTTPKAWTNLSIPNTHEEYGEDPYHNDWDPPSPTESVQLAEAVSKTPVPSRWIVAAGFLIALVAISVIFYQSAGCTKQCHRMWVQSNAVPDEILGMLRSRPSSDARVLRVMDYNIARYVGSPSGLIG
ncbi:hypothetical protein BO70DRAFT_432365 [Aspergillus heteromorphus CBS 117.55]|uniref:Uncharacterized protein n=1 Tax=Aspergillus heteromorphus CBS 117.55 TaxID=1448321 RepID=A0A317V5X1_9EURO|nr:uncharacterized protein BO70DRAFT_432365 [Aspergillus heteromorphus CBS 117.55]PWY69714.1 hypothetical protein BO70DRAFT_432365 [Aspergillus heteromorphus CBS 117.55]